MPRPATRTAPRTLHGGAGSDHLASVQSAIGVISRFIGVVESPVSVVSAVGDFPISADSIDVELAGLAALALGLSTWQSSQTCP
jgi:hypothetical protein